MALYKEANQMSVEQKGWLGLCKEALKGAPESGQAEVEISDKALRASVEVTAGDTMNVRLRSKESDRLLCIARFRRDGQLQTLLDKSKEPWEEFLSPQPG